MSNQADVRIGPRPLAIETALRALVDQAGSTDPALRDRIRAAAEAYFATIPQVSELEREFTEWSRGFVESVVKPPTV